MSLSSLLVNTCSLVPPMRSKSASSGGPTYTDDTSVPSVPCNVQMASGREFMEAMRETGKRFFNVFFGPSTTVTTDYKITNVTGSSIIGMSSVKLKVISPPVDHAGRGTYQMVVAEELP